MKFFEIDQTPFLAERIRLVRRELSEELFGYFRLCRYEAGELLYKEGQQSDYLMILLMGSCKVFKTLENGRTVLLCRYEDFQILGEFELFGDPSAKTNVQTLTSTFCMVIRVSEQRERLLSDNSFLRLVCRKTCAKTERNNINLATNLLYPLEQRLSGYILAMQKEGVFSANYTMLSEYLGCSLRHLLRTFHGLCDKGLLQKAKNAYLILDAELLASVAGDVYSQ